MRIYDGAPHQNYEEVLRSLGAVLDQRGMREITVNETDDGFIVQGLALVPGEERAWNDPQRASRQGDASNSARMTFSRFMDEALARRQGREPAAAGTPVRRDPGCGFYETALRVIGDVHRPADNRATSSSSSRTTSS